MLRLARVVVSFFSDLLSYLRGPEPQPDPDQRETFALRLHAMLMTAGLHTELEMERFALVHADGQVSYLGNHYDYWRTQPEDDREAALLRVAEALLDLSTPPGVPDVWEEAKSGLLLRLQPLHILHTTKLELALQGQESDFDTMAIEIDGTLGVRLVFDTPRSIVQFAADQLETWGVSLETCYERGLRNLRDLNPAPFVPIDEGQWIAAEGDCYDSTRLLMAQEISELAVKGRPVALPANRDVLFITGEHDPMGLHRMLEVAMAAIDQPRLDTLQPLVLDGGRWHNWCPPVGHELHAEFRELGIRTLGGAYADLRALLHETFESKAEEVFVASFGAMEKDGTMHSYAVWAPIPTMLPEAELLAIVIGEEPEPEFVQVPMPKVIELAGDELQRVPDLQPGYWRAKGPPSEALLDKLREHAIPL